MRPAHLSRLIVPRGELRRLALLHAEWALGVGPFEALRSARLAGGLPPDVRPEDIAGERMRVGLPQPDGSTANSVIRLLTRPEGVLVEHLVVRRGPVATMRSATADAPEVVGHVLALAGGLTGDPGHRRALDRVPLERVGALVDDILCTDRTAPVVLVSIDNATRAPLVDPDELARRLTGMAATCFLDSVAASRQLKDELVARGFSEKFGCYNGGVRILWPKIDPADNPYDHLLLLPNRLLGLPPRSCTELVAGMFCEMIAEGEDLRAWLRDVDDDEGAAASRPAPDRTPRPALPRPPSPPARAPAPLGAGRLAALAEIGERVGREDGPRQGSAPPPARDDDNDDDDASVPTPAYGSPRWMPPASVAPPKARARDQTPTRASDEITRARDDVVARVDPPHEPPVAARERETTAPMPSRPVQGVEPTTRTEATPAPAPTPEPLPRPPIDGNANHWMRVASDVVTALELAAELERDLDATRQELLATKKDLRRVEQQRDEMVTAQGELGSVAEALARAEAIYAERLVVLRSARVSAEESPYRDPRRVFFVLVLLASCDLGGIGEVIHRALGPQARWKPKDSPETATAFGRERTWNDATGRPKLYGRHITLGHGVNPQKCLQIYYDVAEDGRIEIAWCGEHRPTVGEDT